MRTWPAAWSVRALLAACLLLSAEVALWTFAARAPADWLPLALGYLALAACALDLALRWRARDIFGLLLLAGLLATAQSAALFPQRALADLPLTLVTRALGAYALAAALALALCLALLRAPRGRRWLLAAAASGLTWGAWVYGVPALTADVAPVSLPLLLLVGAAALGLVGAAVGLVARAGPRLTAADLCLGPAGGAFVTAALAWNLARASESGALATQGALICAALAAYCLLLLRFQRRGSAPTPLEAALPPQTPLWGQLSRAAALFLVGGAAGFLLAEALAFDLAGLLALAFTAYGLVWLPTVSLVLGVEGWRRLTRQRQL
ncbi:MAG: hypothetical protein BroJett033_0080 [Chloroflexota bacterium]|nr:MAG: hypothetical protein BroJett033_0080 [Chloroflexota bacterium]